ncbi:MAG: ArsA family ATPase [Halobacteriaceae archaeon]
MQETAGSERGEATDDAVPVEAVDSLDAGVDSSAPEYVLYGGKGGVGKTTMAAATALGSASDGVPTLVVSTDPAHSLSDTLDADVPDRPVQVREDVPLYAVEIDPETALSEAALFGEGGDLTGVAGDLLGEGGDADGLGAEAMPGADEAAAVQQLLRFLDDDRFDRVVVDTAPTGHTLRLLELPETLDSLLGRVMRLRERLSGMADTLNPLGGAEDEAGPDLDAVKARVRRLRETLRDPARTDFRVVMVPEEMSVRESERLLARLDGFGIPVGTVVVNRVMEDVADVADVPDDAFVTPNVESCAFCERRWHVQQAALGRAQDLFRGHEVRRVPLLADEVRGDRLLRVVAACLA